MLPPLVLPIPSLALTLTVCSLLTWLSTSSSRSVEWLSSYSSLKALKQWQPLSNGLWAIPPTWLSTPRSISQGCRLFRPIRPHPALPDLRYLDTLRLAWPSRDSVLTGEDVLILLSGTQYLWSAPLLASTVANYQLTLVLAPTSRSTGPALLHLRSRKSVESNWHGMWPIKALKVPTLWSDR